jgi:hypothetical protein
MEPQLARTINDDYIWDMDKRLIILETRFDTVLPTLATKADLAELQVNLKIELRDATAHMQKWIIGLGLSFFIGFAGLGISIMQMLPTMVEHAVAAQMKSR